MNFLDTLEEFAPWRSGRVLSKNIFSTSKVGALADDSLMRKHLKGKCIELLQKIAECESIGTKRLFQDQLNRIQILCQEIKTFLITLVDIGYLTPKLHHGLERDVNGVIEDIIEARKELRRLIDLGIISIHL